MAESIGDVHVGDVGTHYKAKIQDAGDPFDPTSAVVRRLIYRTSHGVTFERDAIITTDGADWYLNYTVVEADVDFHPIAGLYKWQGYVEFSDGQKYHTNINTFTVSPNLD